MGPGLILHFLTWLGLASSRAGQGDIIASGWEEQQHGPLGVTSISGRKPGKASQWRQCYQPRGCRGEVNIHSSFSRCFLSMHCVLGSSREGQPNIDASPPLLCVQDTEQLEPRLSLGFLIPGRGWEMALWRGWRYASRALMNSWLEVSGLSDCHVPLLSLQGSMLTALSPSFQPRQFPQPEGDPEWLPAAMRPEAHLTSTPAAPQPGPGVSGSHTVRGAAQVGGCGLQRDPRGGGAHQHCQASADGQRGQRQ